MDLSACPEEQILNQPDMDDCVGCENQDEEVEAMIEGSPSGSEKVFYEFSFSFWCFFKVYRSFRSVKLVMSKCPV